MDEDMARGAYDWGFFDDEQWNSLASFASALTSLDPVLFFSFFFLCAVAFYVVLLGSVEGPATQDPHENPLGIPFLYVALCETFQGSDLGFVLRHTSITMAMVIFL